MIKFNKNNNPSNKKSQSQQAVGYLSRTGWFLSMLRNLWISDILSLKLEKDCRTKVQGISPSLSNKEFLKNTLSICPVCLKKIEAEVYAEGDKVWMKKKCTSHGEYKALLENDAAFYKKYMLIDNIFPPRFSYYLIPIIHRCNKQCKGCYVPNRNIPDMTEKEFRNIISSLPKKNIIFSGGEPTLHPKIYNLIKIADDLGHYTIMNTNGITLADKKFVSGLEKAGLKFLALSFSGKKGRDNSILAIKNVLKTKIYLFLQMNITRGENESLIEESIKTALRYNIENIRIRGHLDDDGRLGIKANNNQYFISDLLELIAIALGEKKDFFRKSYALKEKGENSTHLFNIYIILDKNTRKICDWGPDNPPDNLDNSKYKILTFALFSWQNRFNFDYQEASNYRILHYTRNGKFMNMAEAYFYDL